MPIQTAQLTRVSPSWIGWTLAVTAMVASASPVFADNDQPLLIDSQPVSYWIDQLASDSFSRRERATNLLKGVGDRIIPDLAAATRSGELEVTARVIGILQAIALQQS